MIKLLTNTYTPGSDALATDDWRLDDVNCGNCKHWLSILGMSQEEPQQKGTCDIMSRDKAVDYVNIEADNNIEVLNVTTHKDFGCSLYETKE